jgi:hypothetical protein
LSLKKEKILIVVSSDIFVRNYILTDAFHQIEEEFECFYIANTNVTNTKPIKCKNNFIGFYEINSKSKSINQKIFNALTWRHKSRSKSFQYRLLRSTPSLRAVIKGPRKTLIFRFFKWAILKPLINIKRMLITFDSVAEIYMNYLVSRLTHSKELEYAIENNEYKYLIYPSTAYEPEWLDLVRLCRKNSTKSFFLVDNWDNLSSKTVALEKPDYISVWGQQSKEHAIKIHEFDSNQIFLMGTPRFDSYFKLRNSEIKSYFDFPYILFVGTALNFDEEQILYFINDLIEKNKDSLSGLKVIYRPHPWRQNHIKIEPSYGKNIITDPQSLTGGDDKSIAYQPDLNYYPSLLKNAEYIMGGLTSMLIEGLIFYKQFLAFVIDDGTYMTNMKNAWLYFEHFKGLDSIDAITINESFEEIEKNILSCLDKRLSLNKQTLDIQRNYYLYDDNSSYSERLKNALNEIEENDIN